MQEGIQEGKKEGMQEGMQKGKLEEKRQIAKKMLKSGMDALIIQKFIGLSIQEINELSEQLK